MSIYPALTPAQDRALRRDWHNKNWVNPGKGTLGLLASGICGWAAMRTQQWEWMVPAVGAGVYAVYEFKPKIEKGAKWLKATADWTINKLVTAKFTLSDMAIVSGVGTMAAVVLVESYPEAGAILGIGAGIVASAGSLIRWYNEDIESQDDLPNLGRRLMPARTPVPQGTPLLIDNSQNPVSDLVYGIYRQHVPKNSNLSVNEKKQIMQDLVNEALKYPKFREYFKTAKFNEVLDDGFDNIALLKRNQSRTKADSSLALVDGPSVKTDLFDGEH